MCMLLNLVEYDLTLCFFPQGTLSSLHKVDLSGCQLLTDCGIKWLSEIVTGASKLKHVSNYHMYGGVQIPVATVK